MTAIDAGQMIQYTLAPAVMISSSALLLLGLQNKFSNLFNRFRMLNQECRVLAAAPAREDAQNSRLENVQQQLHRLMKRVRYVKNAILSSCMGIVFFVLTSVSLYLKYFLAVPAAKAAVILFLSGLLCFFSAAVLMIFEVRLAFHILSIESRS